MFVVGAPGASPGAKMQKPGSAGLATTDSSMPLIKPYFTVPDGSIYVLTGNNNHDTDHLIWLGNPASSLPDRTYMHHAYASPAWPDFRIR